MEEADPLGDPLGMTSASPTETVEEEPPFDAAVPPPPFSYVEEEEPENEEGASPPFKSPPQLQLCTSSEDEESPAPAEPLPLQREVSVSVVEPKRVVVYSLDAQEAERIACQLRDALGGEVEWRALETSALRQSPRRRWWSSSYAPSVAVATQPEPKGLKILAHVVEGRTLLLDSDGLYNRFLCDNTDVCLVLTGTTEHTITRADTLASDDVVAELVDAGQASVWPLFRDGRFLTTQHQLSKTQLDQIALLRDGDIPPFAPTPDMRAACGYPAPSSSDAASGGGAVGAAGASGVSSSSGHFSSAASTTQKPSPFSLRAADLASARIVVKNAAVPVLTQLTNSLRSLGEASSGRRSPPSSSGAPRPSPSPIDEGWVFDGFDDVADLPPVGADVAV